MALLVSLLAAAPIHLADPLTDAAETWRETGGWWILEGEWQPRGDGLAAGRPRGTAVWDVAPLLHSGRVAVTVTPRRRDGQAAWAVAGLVLWETPERFWQLGLVEDPDRQTRRIELIENLDGVWQAQQAEGSRLAMSSEGEGTWTWGQAYRLELEWDRTALRGRVARPDQAPFWQVAYDASGGGPVVRQGRPALRADSMDASYRDLEVHGIPAQRPPAAGPAVLLDGPGPWVDAQWPGRAEALRAILRDAGYEVRATPADQVTGEALAGTALVAAPSLEVLPEPAMRAVAEFVAAGGDLLATGGRPFATPLVATRRGAWTARDEALAELVEPRWIVQPAAARDLRRSSDRMDLAPVFRHGVEGPTGQPDALALELPNLSGWDVLATPPFAASPFGPGETLTVLTVRGTPGQMLSVEWKEDDGSRWIAAVPLAAGWRRWVLEPSRFKFWQDSAAPGRALTEFRPAHAQTLAFGPAVSHGARPGRIEYAIGPLGVAASPFAGEPFEAPILETISPWYKQFDTARQNQPVRVPIARPRGLTLAADPDGRFSVQGDLERPGATRWQTVAGANVVWLPTVRLSDADRAGVVGWLASARVGIGLLNAGPRQVVALVDEPLVVGARAVGTAATELGALARFTLRGPGGAVPLGERELRVSPGGRRGAALETGRRLTPGSYTVETELTVGNRVVDRLLSPLRVVDPAAARSDGRRVTVRDGVFQARGRRVFLNGVNYWPRFIAGAEPARFWAHWLEPRAYDPDLVDADLRVMAQLGLNLVSVSYSGGDQARPMMDFLARCRAHGIWANVYINAAATWDRAALDGALAAMRAAHLPGDDTVAAYDLKWEPRLGDQLERRTLDERWRAWVVEQYGSLDAAERTWGIDPPRDDAGLLSNPNEAMLESDGSHRVYVAAYRRFADDLISRHYGAVIAALRELDPDTLMGVRTGYGGTGQAFPNRVMAYDLVSGAAHLDFVSPEGYGLPADFEQGRRTGFVTAYADWAGGGKPVFWCEFGQSIGPFGGSAEMRQRQTDIWDCMYEVIVDSGADAAAGWWWPGGWRLGEESDYGVIEPDGTPREALRQAAEWGRELAQATVGSRGEPVVIAIDRDSDPRALFGLWQTHGDAYVEARAAGRPVRLVTPGTGTTTATLPRVQVGGLPYQGAGPLAYANAEITPVYERVDGARAMVRFRLVNTGEATWLPNRAAAGGVVLQVGGQTIPLTREVARFGREELGPVAVDLSTRPVARLAIAGIGPFGQAVELAAP